jgi:hypothetical protein
MDATESGTLSRFAVVRFGDTLRRWNACRRRGGVREHMAELLQSVLPYVESLQSSSLREFISPSQEESSSIMELWSVLESGLCLSKPASEVGISKSIMLLTRGRIGPAFDSTVRDAFGLRRINNARELLEVYKAVANDLRQFEHVNHVNLEELVPTGRESIGVGRIVDMVAGPRAKATQQEWFERKVAELKTELEKLPADRQEQLKRELEQESEQ